MPNVFRLVQQAVVAWVDDRAPSMGAALSYYTVFSAAPLLLIVIAIAGLAFGGDGARSAIVAQLQQLLGQQVGSTVEELLAHAAEPRRGLLATVIGIAALVVGATTVFAELQDDLDRIWKAPQRNRPSGAWGWIRTRLLSFGLVLTAGFLMLVSLLASAALHALGTWMGPLFGTWEVLAQGLNLLLSFAVITVMFALLYRYLPQTRIEWRDVWLGAAVTALLFTIGKFLIGLYIGRSAVASAFGAAGSLAVLLVWVYYSAQIFLLGAEFTWVQARARRPQEVASTETASEGGRPRQDVSGQAPEPAPERPLEPSHILIAHPLRWLGAAAAVGMVTTLAASRFVKRRRAHEPA